VGGPVAEVWRYGQRAGVLWDWQFRGWAGEFKVEAERYKLDPLLFTNGKREVDIMLPVGPQELRAKGIIWTEYTADGKSHRAIVIKGGQSEWQNKRAVSATAS